MDTPATAGPEMDPTPGRSGPLVRPQAIIERTLDSPVSLTLLVMACLFPLMVFWALPDPFTLK